MTQGGDLPETPFKASERRRARTGAHQGHGGGVAGASRSEAQSAQSRRFVATTSLG